MWANARAKADGRANANAGYQHLPAVKRSFRRQGYAAAAAGGLANGYEANQKGEAGSCDPIVLHRVDLQ